MSITTKYPEYASIAEQIENARAERSIAIAHMIADAVDAVVRGLKDLQAGFKYGVRVENNLHALAVDALFRKTTPRY